MNNNQLNPENSPFAATPQPGRSRVKVAVFSVLAVHVAGLTALLLTQGCKREAQPLVEPDPEPPLIDTNSLFYNDTNLPPELPPVDGSFVPPGVDPYSPPGGVQPPPTVPTPPPVTSAGEYVVKSGDSFYSIAKTHGTTIKAIEAANPGVDSRRLKIGQKLVLPAGGSTATAPTASSSMGENVYVVKSGDTLTRIASQNNTTVKELKSLNGLATDRINVGQKLKLPAPAPVTAPMTAPVAPPVYSAPPTTVPTQP